MFLPHRVSSYCDTTLFNYIRSLTCFICFISTICKTLRMSVFNKELLTYLLSRSIKPSHGVLVDVVPCWSMEWSADGEWKLESWNNQSLAVTCHCGRQLHSRNCHRSVMCFILSVCCSSVTPFKCGIWKVAFKQQGRLWSYYWCFYDSSEYRDLFVDFQSFGDFSSLTKTRIRLVLFFCSCDVVLSLVQFHP